MMYILNITTVTYLTFTFVSGGISLNIVQFQFLNYEPVHKLSGLLRVARDDEYGVTTVRISPKENVRDMWKG
jgi:hypothetical protein